MKRFFARVKGRVQGVGFRYFVMRKASSYNLCGYVRNCQNGDVEVEAEGEKDQLDLLARDLREGPSLSRVKDVRLEWFEDEKGYKGFDLKW